MILILLIHKKCLHHSISYVNVKLLNNEHVTSSIMIIFMNSISLNDSMGFESFDLSKGISHKLSKGNLNS